MARDAGRPLPWPSLSHLATGQLCPGESRKGDPGRRYVILDAPLIEVRGIVSASVDGHSDEIFWTEALDIYNTFHVHLV